MKKGINYWSFPGVLSGKPKFDLQSCMELAKDAGFEGIELAIDEQGEINLTSSERSIRNIARIAKEIGLEIISLATLLFRRYSLTSSDQKNKEKAQEIVKKMLEIAFNLGTDAILILPGAVEFPGCKCREVIPYDLAHERAVNVLGEIIPIAQKYKICIALENAVWNKFLLSPLEIRKFVDTLGSEYVGVYVDVGNILAIGGVPEDWIKILDQRVRKVHIKDFRTSVGNINGFVNLLEGDVNWKGVITSLNKIGYSDYLTAEISAYSQFPEALIYNISKSMDFILGREGSGINKDEL